MWGHWAKTVAFQRSQVVFQTGKSLWQPGIFPTFRLLSTSLTFMHNYLEYTYFNSTELISFHFDWYLSVLSPFSEILSDRHNRVSLKFQGGRSDRFSTAKMSKWKYYCIYVIKHRDPNKRQPCINARSKLVILEWTLGVFNQVPSIYLRPWHLIEFNAFDQD